MAEMWQDCDLENATLGGSQGGRRGVACDPQNGQKSLFEHYPTDYHVAKGNFATPCDTLATPLRHPPIFDYSSTPTTLIRDLIWICDPQMKF